MILCNQGTAAQGEAPEGLRTAITSHKPSLVITPKRARSVSSELFCFVIQLKGSSSSIPSGTCINSSEGACRKGALGELPLLHLPSSLAQIASQIFC